MSITSYISGLGSYTPENEVKNADFLNHQFLHEDGSPFDQENKIIVEKFKSITGIEARRYASDDEMASDLAFKASLKAIERSNLELEDLDYIIVAHNFGDLKKGSTNGDILPSLASRVKQKLAIKNPNCIAYDLLYGCPGWLQGVIHADAFIKAGLANNALVIGTETLSRVVDASDRDSMIFADGAGACVMEKQVPNAKEGILATAAQTYANEEADYLFSGVGNVPDDKTEGYIKMKGRKIYEFALTKVPAAMKIALDKSGASIDDVKKIFIHQANEKMDEAIVKRFFRLYKKQMPDDVMPMNIHELGNSSVATIPTLMDMVINDRYGNHKVEKGDLIILASVGAGMNINAVIYRY
ncbi:MAG: 3-oxoacyl-ACP synthase III family protein [Flavobacteriaceae bacterium]